MNKGMILGLLATVLTAQMGTINYNGHRETWYDLKMDRVVKRANAYYGIKDVYEVREDGVKTYNGFVICAVHKSVPYGTLIDTSKGVGIALDYHTMKDSSAVDIATDWRDKK